ncbi:MAG: thiosulfate oxidation carrier complex protein SoxZ [bacterium]
MLKARISVPARAGYNEVVAIKTLISHPMETGFRHDSLGQPIPRNILTRFECRYNGQTVFKASLYPAIAANPFIGFYLRAREPGELEFIWTDQNNEVTRLTRELTVEPES